MKSSKQTFVLVLKRDAESGLFALDPTKSTKPRAALAGSKRGPVQELPKKEIVPP